MLSDDLMQLMRDLLMMICTEPFYAVVFWVGSSASVRGRCRSYLCVTKCPGRHLRRLSPARLLSASQDQGSPLLDCLSLSVCLAASIRRVTVGCCQLAIRLPAGKESRCMGCVDG
jgi:hypothetical protein